MKISQLIASLRMMDPDLDVSVEMFRNRGFLEGEELAACYDRKGELKVGTPCDKATGRPVGFARLALPTPKPGAA